MSSSIICFKHDLYKNIFYTVQRALMNEVEGWQNIQKYNNNSFTKKNIKNIGNEYFEGIVAI